MNQQYGVLRVVRVRAPANATTELQQRYPTGWLPEERLVHLLSRRETTIGRALSNDVWLMDPTVSREHAQLIFDEGQGWRICNLTLHNIVRVNGRHVSSGECLSVQPQDYIVLGSTMLQLIAPQTALNDSECPIPLLDPRKQENPLNNHQNHVIGQNGTAPLKDDNVLTKYQFRRPSQRATPLAATALPEQPEPELVAQPWEDEDEEQFLGVGVTLQFALPQRMGTRTRWIIGGFGIAVLVMSTIIMFIINSLIGINALMQDGPSSIVAALTVPLIPAISIVLLVNFIDRFEREPWFLRLGAFLWGAIIAIPPALFIEQQIGTYIQSAADPLLHSALIGLNAGFTEETIKGLGLLLLFFVLRDEFDNVTDGIVYGALIGAGFAMAENFVYFASNSKHFFLFLVIMRVVLGWLCHSTFTVCFGAALGYVRHTRVRWRMILVPLCGYLLAIGLHSVFDFVDYFANAIVLSSPNDATVIFFSWVAVIGDYIPPFITQIVLLYFLMKALAHEAAVIREFLASEVGSGMVTVGEYTLLQNSFQRTREERRVLRQSGFHQWLRVKDLYQTEIGLAFRKWHVSMGDQPKLGSIQPEDAYRQRIKRLRQDIANAEAKKKL